MSLRASGAGSRRSFLRSALNTELEMIDVNCRAVAALVYTFGNRFVRRGAGGIVLLSSLVTARAERRPANLGAGPQEFEPSAPIFTESSVVTSPQCRSHSRKARVIFDDRLSDRIVRCEESMGCKRPRPQSNRPTWRKALGPHNSSLRSRATLDWRATPTS